MLRGVIVPYRKSKISVLFLLFEISVLRVQCLLFLNVSLTTQTYVGQEKKFGKKDLKKMFESESKPKSRLPTRCCKLLFLRPKTRKCQVGAPAAAATTPPTTSTTTTITTFDHSLATGLKFADTAEKSFWPNSWSEVKADEFKTRTFTIYKCVAYIKCVILRQVRNLWQMIHLASLYGVFFLYKIVIWVLNRFRLN